jgi:hypothetical protein
MTKGQRHVLIVPLDAVRQQFAGNERQDIKLVAPEILSDALIERLRVMGKSLKPEQMLAGDVWRHAAADEPNHLCESSEFSDEVAGEAAGVRGPFALSIATERSEQDEHYHRHHIEVYFSEHAIGGTYRLPGDPRAHALDLPAGGAVIFGPGVIHHMRLGGMTLVIELPAVADDKVTL